MRFTESFVGWTQGRLTQAEAAFLLGHCERSFRRHIERYEANGLEGLLDKRLSQISRRQASGVEVDRVVELYKIGFAGWNVADFNTKYGAEFVGAHARARQPAWARCARAGQRRSAPRWPRQTAVHAQLRSGPGLADDVLDNLLPVAEMGDDKLREF